VQALLVADLQALLVHVAESSESDGGQRPQRRPRMTRRVKRRDQKERLDVTGTAVAHKEF
jgi:hypothetical protein